MNIIKKTAITLSAVAVISMTALGASASEAQAGWHKKNHHFKFHYSHHYAHNNYNYCKPRYKKVWVYSSYHGHKVKRYVKVGCYYDYYGH